MKFSLSDNQRHDQMLGEAEQILRRCLHCGLCTATCPSYQILGDERDSPRGRIYLIKQMLEEEGRVFDVKEAPNADGSTENPAANTPVIGQLTKHMDRCLSCFACMTTCPSGVNYRHLSDYARVRAQEGGHRSFGLKMRRKLLGAVLPYPRRFSALLGAGRLFKWAKTPLAKLGFQAEAAMLGQIPPLKLSHYFAAQKKPISDEEKHDQKGQVILFKGCVQSVLRPGINEAMAYLCRHGGYGLIEQELSFCCGSVDLHMGKEEKAKEFACKNIDSWWDIFIKGDLDAIIITASGCGASVKDYAHLLSGDPVRIGKLEKLLPLVKDPSEFLLEMPLAPPESWSDIKVAFQTPCSMKHSLKIQSEPFQLLEQSGFKALSIKDDHLCCGSAGTYSILQSDISNQLKAKKIKTIKDVRPDVVTTGNIGCLTHLSADLDVPIVHLVELVSLAYGGPVAPELAHLKSRFSAALSKS